MAIQSVLGLLPAIPMIWQTEREIYRKRSLLSKEEIAAKSSDCSELTELLLPLNHRKDKSYLVML